MADKPKTYPQQVQELKQQLESALNEKEEALNKASFFTEMSAEIAHLKALVEEHNIAARQNGVGNKAQMTDLEQRAVSAEQGIKNQQQKINQLTAENNALTQQLDIAGMDRDRNLGKEAKNQAVFEELQRSNLLVARLNQRLRDQDTEKNAVIESYANELRYLRQLTKSQENTIAELTDAIRTAPDLVANLKRIAGLS